MKVFLLKTDRSLGIAVLSKEEADKFLLKKFAQSYEEIEVFETIEAAGLTLHEDVVKHHARGNETN